MVELLLLGWVLFFRTIEKKSKHLNVESLRMQHNRLYTLDFCSIGQSSTLKKKEIHTNPLETILDHDAECFWLGCIKLETLMG